MIAKEFNELETATLPCSEANITQNVQWEYRSLTPGSEYGIIYYPHGLMKPGYAERFSVNTTSAANNALVIRPLKITDAGLYKCITDDGFGAWTITNLTVAGSVYSNFVGIGSKQRNSQLVRFRLNIFTDQAGASNSQTVLI